MGSDHASRENRRLYPLRKLMVVNFAGVRGEAQITFGALTLILGTMKLSNTICDLLRIFSGRDTFEATRQPASTDSEVFDRIPLPDGREWGITVRVDRPRIFTSQGKLRLRLSDGREFIVTTKQAGATLSLDDTPIPVFTPVVRAIAPGRATEWNNLGSGVHEDQSGEEALPWHFGVSLRELVSCLQGVPTDESVFHYDYAFDAHKGLVVSIGPTAEHRPVRSLSGGELSRVILDVAVRAATYSARIGSTVLLINQSEILMDPEGWAVFLGWIERKRPPFQTIVDLCYMPSQARLSRALCYEAQGTDMHVSAIELKALKSFKQNQPL